MKKTNTLIAVAAAVVLLPGLLTACAGSPSGDSTDKASGSGKGSGASMSSCMRDKGYDMPDPDSSQRKQALSAPEGVDEQQWTIDLKSCMGAAGSGEVETSSAFGTPEQAKKIAECVRASGFTDYPDDANAAASYRPDDESAFQEASQKCIDDVIGSDGSAGISE